jgi:NitT/TauT family transport system substrate-binding protein
MNRRKFLKKLSSVASTAVLPSFFGQPASAASGSLSLLTATAPPDLVSHIFYYAEALGFYKEAGLTFKLAPVANDPTALRGVLAGEADIAWCGALTTFQALRTGASLKVLSSFVPKLDYKILAAKSIATTKDLAGQPVAVSQVGAVSQIVPKIMISEAGGDTSTVQWVSAGGGPNRFQALVAGRVQAAALNALHGNMAAKMADKYHVLATASQTMPDFLYTLEIIPSKVAQEKKGELQAFVAATQKASRWTLESPKEAAALSKKILPDVPLPDLEEAISDFVKTKYWSASGDVSLKSWNYTISSLLKSGDLANAPSEDVLINKSL